MTDLKRRDFINGSAVAIAGSLSGAFPRFSEGSEPSTYPPALTGLRGSHPGSNAVAHQHAWSGGLSTDHVRETDEHYDLVVVGAGLSGLAAAVFFASSMASTKRFSFWITTMTSAATQGATSM